MLKITAETEKKSGQQSGFRALWGKARSCGEGIMNDGESFFAFFFGFLGLFAEHFFSLHENAQRW
jgi:hypothetical protein